MLKLLHITFTQISNKLINASLSFHSKKMARHIVEVEGVSRKQCAFLLCNKGIVPWGQFDDLTKMAMACQDPRLVNQLVRRQSSSEARDERLGDICDDMGCSAHEARRFLDHGTLPSGW